jgi:hypothetical protein
MLNCASVAPSKGLNPGHCALITKNKTSVAPRIVNLSSERSQVAAIPALDLDAGRRLGGTPRFSGLPDHKVFACSQTQRDRFGFTLPNEE